MKLLNNYFPLLALGFTVLVWGVSPAFIRSFSLAAGAADALVIRGISVDEISSKTRSQPHALTSFARVKGTTITYPPPDPALAG